MASPWPRQAPTFGQCRIGIDFHAPGFVVRQVPMEAVELVPGENAEQLLDFSPAIELTGNVEMKATPSHGWLVAYLAFDGEAECVRIKMRAAPDLAERDQTIEQARLCAGGDANDITGEGHAIGLRRETVDDLQHGRHSAF